MNGPVQTFPPLHDLSRVPPGRVLVVAPHPDDEIIGCGGAIALHHRRGDPVSVALVTSGEVGGEAQVRLEESRRAAACLGPAEVSCLEARDGAVAADDTLAERLAALVDRVAPQVVYAPSPWEMHPDHVATLHAVAAALRRRDDLRLLLFEVNTECMATFLLDITAVNPVKREALETFASQLGLIDVVNKVDARNRARTVNVDLRDVTHAEAFMELAPSRLPEVFERLHRLGEVLDLPRP